MILFLTLYMLASPVWSMYNSLIMCAYFQVTEYCIHTIIHVHCTTHVWTWVNLLQPHARENIVLYIIKCLAIWTDSIHIIAKFISCVELLHASINKRHIKFCELLQLILAILHVSCDYYILLINLVYFVHSKLQL